MCVEKEVFCQSVLEGLRETQCDGGAVHRRVVSIPAQPSPGKADNISHKAGFVRLKSIFKYTTLDTSACSGWYNYIWGLLGFWVLL